MATKVKKKNNVERFIYIGPNLPDARLARYQVFIGGLPTHVPELFAAYDWLQKLFVPVAELNTAELAVKTAGTPLNKYYLRAVSEVK